MSNNSDNLSQDNVSQKVAFIGAGNMAKAIVGGLITAGWDSKKIIVSNPGKTKIENLQAQYSINITQDNHESANFAEVIILSVKPQKLAQVCSQLSHCDLSDKLIISIAAGYQTDSLAENLAIKSLAQPASIIRAMPNTPALIGAGITGLYATQATSAEQKEIAEQIFNSIGKVTWIEEESHMDIVTAIAGSGPAYFFLMMQAMQEQAIKSGLEAQQAYDLITQTAFGAALLAQQSQQEQNYSLETLRKQVTSPGGTTAAAINSLINNDFEAILKQAVNAAIKRGQELAKNN